MYKKILVPLDGSELAEAVLPHAEALAKLDNSEIIILKVSDMPLNHFLARDPFTAETIRKNAEKESEKYVYKKVTSILKIHIKASGMVKEGSVPDMILEAAEQTHADMIAMSTHGRTGLLRWLMGSIADTIVSHTHIPVMLIHPN